MLITPVLLLIWNRKDVLKELVLDGLFVLSLILLKSCLLCPYTLHAFTFVHQPLNYVNIIRQLKIRRRNTFSVISFFLLHRTTPKTQYTGCSVHENNNGQAAFENPMYNTNAKAVEGKAVRFDPNLNTVCTMV